MGWQPADTEVVSMTVQAQTLDARPVPAQKVAERTARYVPGLRMLVLGLVILIAAGILLWQASHSSGHTAVALDWAGALLVIAGLLELHGLTAIVPGRAHVVQLFGNYRGTIREPGLQWVNPFTNRIPVSVRIRNLESAQLKVNDADGNPIEIAAVVVWQVADTAHAIYAVDDYTRFVAIQTETAVRHVASDGF
jgi:regulator of protease activity HflC (stomatin/prohibitin superfamily)